MTGRTSPHKKPIPLIPRGSLSEEVEEDQRVNWLMQICSGKMAVEWK